MREYVFRQDCFHRSDGEKHSGDDDKDARVCCHWQSRADGNDFFTLLAITCPHGPCPSNIPQNVMSSWHPNPYIISIEIHKN